MNMPPPVPVLRRETTGDYQYVPYVPGAPPTTYYDTPVAPITPEDSPGYKSMSCGICEFAYTVPGQYTRSFIDREQDRLQLTIEWHDEWEAIRQELIPYPKRKPRGRRR